MGGEQAGRAPAGHGQAAGARASGPAARPGQLRRVRDAGRLDGSCAAGGPGLPRRRRDGGGRRRHRRPPRRRLRLRLHRPGRIDGRDRRVEDRPPAGAGAAPAHPGGVAARLRRSAHPVVVGLDLRGRRRAVPGAGHAERRGAAGGGHARALRGRHGLHPGAGRLHPDGEGHLVDGSRRPAPRPGGHRRGGHRGGDGRFGGPHQGLRRRRPGGGVRRGVPRRRAAVPVLLPVPQPGAAAGAVDVGPRRPSGRGAVHARADRAPAGLRHDEGGAAALRRR